MLNPVSHSESTINVPFFGMHEQGVMIAKSYAQEFIFRRNGVGTPWEHFLPDIHEDENFNRGLSAVKKQYFRSIRTVLAHLGELHRLVTFKWIHEFYRIQDLFFLFLEELIDLYHLQNPDDVLMEPLLTKLKHRHAITVLQVFNNNTRDKVAKILNQIFARLLAAKILSPTAHKVFAIYQKIFMMKHMSDIPLINFYHPSMHYDEWKVLFDIDLRSEVITCSLDTVKEIFSRELGKLKKESSFFCEMIPQALEKVNKSIRKHLDADIFPQLEEAFHQPALEYHKHFPQAQLPKLSELQAINIFSASEEELLKWELFFEKWRELPREHFPHRQTSAPSSVQKRIAHLPVYLDNFVLNSIVALLNIITALRQKLPVKIEEPSLGLAKPYDALTRSFFEKSHMPKAPLEPSGQRETRGGSAKPKPVKKKKVKNTAPEKKESLPKHIKCRHYLLLLFTLPIPEK